MKKVIMSILTIAAASALALVAPVTASATNSSNHDAASASLPGFSTHCATGRVASLADRLPIRDLPSLGGRVITIAQKGDQFNCTKNVYWLGDRYDACGGTNANGWIEILFPTQVGFTYMTCLKDV